MAKLNLPDIGSLDNSLSAQTAINDNFTRIEDAIENTISRNGLAPNNMEQDLDLDGNKILNVGDPISETGAVNLRTAKLISVDAGSGDSAIRWDLASDDVGKGSALVQFLQSGSGASARSVTSKLRESVSILDFIPTAEHSAIFAGTSSYDCRPALLAAIEAARRPASSQSASFGSGSNDVFIPPGTYPISSRVDLKTAVRIYGVDGGDANSNESSVLVFPADSHGIVIHAHNTIGDGVEATPTTQGSGAIIEGLFLKGSGTTSGHGIWMRGRATIRQCRVLGFAGNGVNIVASAGAGGINEGNANNWYLDKLRITNIGGHGVFVDGADVNAGVGIGVDTTGTGQCGIFDSSFLGNTWIACHTDTNGKKASVHYGGNRYYAINESLAGTTTPGTDATVWGLVGAGGVHPHYPEWVSGGTYKIGYAYHSDSINSAGVFLGCYTEGGYPPSRLLRTAIWLGGRGAVTPDSTMAQIVSSFGGALKSSQGFESERPAGSATLTTRFGVDGTNGDIIYITHSTAAPNVWRFRVTGNDLEFNYQNSALNRSFLITGPNTSLAFGRSAPVPHAFNLNRLWVGNGANARHQNTGTAAPTTGEWARGDIVWNINAAAGGKVGWVCVAAGTPGTWKPFGAIDP
jgi:hypothetical protein